MPSPPGTTAQAWNPNTGEWRQADPRSSLTSWSSQKREVLHIPKEALSQSDKVKKWLNILVLTSGLHWFLQWESILSHTCIQTHVYTYSHVYAHTYMHTQTPTHTQIYTHMLTIPPHKHTYSFSVYNTLLPPMLHKELNHSEQGSERVELLISYSLTGFCMHYEAAPVRHSLHTLNV